LYQFVGVEILLGYPAHGGDSQLAFYDGGSEHRSIEPPIPRPRVAVHPLDQRLEVQGNLAALCGMR
jgi:hypothetical protein